MTISDFECCTSSINYLDFLVTYNSLVNSSRSVHLPGNHGGNTDPCGWDRRMEVDGGWYCLIFFNSVIFYINQLVVDFQGHRCPFIVSSSSISILGRCWCLGTYPLWLDDHFVLFHPTTESCCGEACGIDFKTCPLSKSVMFNTFHLFIIRCLLKRIHWN